MKHRDSFQKNFSDEIKKTQQKPFLSKSAYRDFIDYLNRNYRDKFTHNVYIFSQDKKTQAKFKGAMSSYAKLSEGERPLICYDIEVDNLPDSENLTENIPDVSDISDLSDIADAADILDGADFFDDMDIF